MTVVDLRLKLPDALARDAQAAGLLSEAALIDLLRAEVRRAAARRLAKSASWNDEVGMALADIQHEVDQVRAATGQE